MNRKNGIRTISRLLIICLLFQVLPMVYASQPNAAADIWPKEFRLQPDTFSALDPAAWSWVVAETAPATTYSKQSYGTLYFGKKAGDYISYDLNVPTEGMYKISFMGYLATAGGIAQIKLDNQVVGQYDFRRATAGYGSYTELAELHLTKGVHRFRFEIAGTSGTGYAAYISTLKFEPGAPQQEQYVLWTMPPGLVPDLALPHPRVFHDSSNLALAQSNLSSGPGWAQHVSNDIVTSLQSQPWFAMTDAQLLSHIPSTGSYYTYMATNVCPDGTSMTPIGWSQPGKVRCGSGAIMPDASHPDDGTGWADAQGNKYYFVARWNGFVLQEIEKALPNLAYAYHFTGDPVYAHKASLLLDAVATIYPQAIEGPLDYPGAAPGKEGGRLQRPKYQAARSLAQFVEAADLLWDSAAFNQPSETNPGATVKQNVVYNLLLNAADYCYREAQKPGYVDQLHNGTADYNMGILAVGSLLGIEAYIDWTWNGPTSVLNMIANNIDRDGNYYETAASYSQAAQEIYLQLAEILVHLRTTDYPEGIDLYQNPQFEKFYIGFHERNSIAGRLALYGDSLVDSQTTTDTVFNKFAFSTLLKFYARTANPDKRQEYAQMLQNMAKGDPNLRLNTAWAVMNISGITEHDPSLPAQERSSEAFGGKGLVFMRTGEGDAKRGVFLRYGATLNHGQYDELSALIYDAGRELSFDPGYSNAQYRVGWQQQTVAHLTTVVNEKSQLSASSSGGSMNFFSTGDGVTVTDVSDEGAYAAEGVSLYRRQMAVVDTSDTSSYILDIFRINGGSTRDYSFHSRGNGFQTNGLTLSPPAAGSVASPDYDWGDKVRADGYIEGYENQGFYYVAEPGNGYGFMGNPRHSETNGQWSALWSSDAAQLRLTMLPQEGREIITARGPLPMENGVTYLLARDQGLQPSQYVSVIETGAANSIPNRTVSPLTVTDHPGGLLEPVALTVTEGPVTDYFLSTLEKLPFRAENSDGLAVSTDAEWATARRDADGIRRAQVTKGTHLVMDDFAISGFRPEVTGTVIDVDYEAGSLLIQADDLLGTPFEGSQILLDNDAYSHNSPYTVKSIVPESTYYRVHLDPGTLLLAKGRVQGTPSGSHLPNFMNLPYSRNVARLGPNDYFTGKRVENDNGTSTRIQSVKPDYAGLTVDSASGFQNGDELYMYDVQPGDRFSIPITVRVERQAGGGYLVHSPVPVQLDIGEPQQPYVKLVSDQYRVYEGRSAQLSLGGTLDITGGTVTYRSSDPTIAAVDFSGKVRGLQGGWVTLTADVALNGTTYSTSLLLEIVALPGGTVKELRLFPDAFTQLDPSGWTWIVAETATGTTYNKQNSYGTLYASGKTGDYIAYDLSVPEDGIYAVSFRGYTAPYGGISEIRLDDERLGQYDFYASPSGFGLYADYTKRYLSAGVHRLLFEVIGKNPASSNYGTYVADLKLVPYGLKEVRPKLARETWRIGETVELRVGGVLQGNVPADLTGASIAYSSNRPDVAEIDGNGLIRMKSEGTAVIEAAVTLDGLTRSGSVQISVYDPIESIMLSGLPVYMAPLEKVQSVVYAVYGGQTFDIAGFSHYTSSNPEAASVSSGGLVEALSPGTTVIQAVYGRHHAQFTITVQDVPGMLQAWEASGDLEKPTAEVLGSLIRTALEHLENGRRERAVERIRHLIDFVGRGSAAVNRSLDDTKKRNLIAAAERWIGQIQRLQ